jgi:hypothetical protein
MCGSDGHYHCSSSCTGAPNAGADASAGGTVTGGSDGGTFGGGGPQGGQCVQGAACQAGSGPCANASVGGSCSMCTCGAGGTLTCVPCDQKPPLNDDAGMGGSTTTICQQGASCAQGPTDCGGGVQGVCQMCHCDAATGTYQCVPCADAKDGGAPFVGADAGGGGGGPPPGCSPGAQCNPGDSCGNGAQGGACYACQCGQTGTYQCGPCGGAKDGGAPPPAGDAGASNPQLPPDLCNQGLKCPQPGAACMGLTVNGVCPKCMCGADGTLACVQAACQ